MSIRTPKARVSGHGSAKGGTHHWWAQRVTAVALIVLTYLFLVPFIRALGAPYETVQTIYSRPINAISAILFFGVAFWHLKLGLQVIIEDYVHIKSLKTTAMLLNTLFCWGLGVAGIVSLAMIAF